MGRKFMKNRPSTIHLVFALALCLALAAVLLLRNPPGVSSAQDNDAGPLFPAPTTESGLAGYLMRMYHGLSDNPPPETRAERNLIYNDFDPLPLTAACFDKSYVPDDLAPRFLKKSAWWPEVSMNSQAVSRRDAAAVVRYKVPGWTIQIIASRGRNAFIAQNTDHQVDWTPDETILGLPKCFGQVFDRTLFDLPKPSYATRASFPRANGSTFESYDAIDLDIKPALKGSPFIGGAFWLDNVLVLTLTPMAHVPTVPTSAGPKPLFLRRVGPPPPATHL
jgi:hypothetical protein